MDKSLLHRQADADGVLRFRMLETVREFALEQLAASGELEEACRRHAAFFLRIADEAVAGPQGLEEARRSPVSLKRPPVCKGGERRHRDPVGQGRL